MARKTGGENRKLKNIPINFKGTNCMLAQQYPLKRGPEKSGVTWMATCEFRPNVIDLANTRKGASRPIKRPVSAGSLRPITHRSRNRRGPRERSRSRSRVTTCRINPSVRRTEISIRRRVTSFLPVEAADFINDRRRFKRVFFCLRPGRMRVRVRPNSQKTIILPRQP